MQPADANSLTTVVTQLLDFGGIIMEGIGMTDNSGPAKIARTRDLLLRAQGGDLHAVYEFFAHHRA